MRALDVPQVHDRVTIVEGKGEHKSGVVRTSWSTGFGKFFVEVVLEDGTTLNKRATDVVQTGAK